MVAAALISWIGQFTLSFENNVQLRTSLACYQLADVSILRTVRIWGERRKPGYGDILGQKIELWNPVPYTAFGWELEAV